jgi:hypothetical protein
LGAVKNKELLDKSTPSPPKTRNNELELVKKSIFCHKKQQEPAHIMSDSIITELEFCRVPKEAGVGLEEESL